MEEQGTWASRARNRSEAGCGRPEDGGVGTANIVKRPPEQPAHPQYANYWARLTRKRHILPHPAQPRHTNYWAPRTRKRHQQEHRPWRSTERSDPTQHAKGGTGECPGPRKETTTGRNVTQGGGGGCAVAGGTARSDWDGGATRWCGADLTGVVVCQCRGLWYGPHRGLPCSLLCGEPLLFPNFPLQPKAPKLVPLSI